jgi:hypothetical protein
MTVRFPKFAEKRQSDRTRQFAACPIIADGKHSYDLEYRLPTEVP